MKETWLLKRFLGQDTPILYSFSHLRMLKIIFLLQSKTTSYLSFCYVRAIGGNGYVWSVF